MKKLFQLSIILICGCMLASCGGEEAKTGSEQDYGRSTESTSNFTGQAKKFVKFMERSRWVRDKLSKNQVQQIAATCNDEELVVILRYFKCVENGMHRFEVDWDRDDREEKKCGKLRGDGGKLEKFSAQCQSEF